MRTDVGSDIHRLMSSAFRQVYRVSSFQDLLREPGDLSR